MRGAASKSYGPGKIDLVAINPKLRIVFLLQAKNYKQGGLTRGQKERSELWEVFNPDFERQNYTLDCEIVTSIRDIELIEERAIKSSVTQPTAQS